MKRSNNFKLAVTGVSAVCASSVGVLAKAMHYSHAARRDEQNGFCLTAAMEWRLAAELFGSNTFAANHYWRQWERIMHLPRKLASPIDDAAESTANEFAAANERGNYAGISELALVNVA